MPPKRKPTKPSPKPAAKHKAPGDPHVTAKGEPRKRAQGAGRPEGTGFHPTSEQRNLVKAMTGYKIPMDEICMLVINPKSKRPVSTTTLQKHFRDELDTGFVSGKMRVMAATFRNAIGEQKQNPDGTISVVREGNVTAQIWLGKTLYGMREMVQVDVPPPPPDAEHNLLDAARRVAFTLAMGASIAEKQPAPKAKTKQHA